MAREQVNRVWHCDDKEKEQEAEGFCGVDHSSNPSASATVKMSLSPRPETLTTMI